MPLGFVRRNRRIVRRRELRGGGTASSDRDDSVGGGGEGNNNNNNNDETTTTATSTFKRRWRRRRKKKGTSSSTRDDNDPFPVSFSLTVRSGEDSDSECEVEATWDINAELGVSSSSLTGEREGGIFRCGRRQKKGGERKKNVGLRDDVGEGDDGDNADDTNTPTCAGRMMESIGQGRDLTISAYNMVPFWDDRTIETAPMMTTTTTAEGGGGGLEREGEGEEDGGGYLIGGPESATIKWSFDDIEDNWSVRRELAADDICM